MDTNQVLEDEVIQLLPMQLFHQEELTVAALDPDLWKHTPTILTNASDVHRYIEKAINKRQHGQHIPYVIKLKSNGQLIGASRFYDIDNKNKTTAIGYTWLIKEYRGKGINARLKHLMLKYAFQHSMVRVALYIDKNNIASRKAAEKIGFTQEGILRKHLLLASGKYRDTVVYSYIDSDQLSP